MVSWKQWLEPGRRLLVMFLAIAVLLAGTLLWLGWQLARQERELAAQRLQERREIVADLAVAALQKSLSQAEEQLANLATLPISELRQRADSLPGDCVLILARGGKMEAYPEKRLPFYPVTPTIPGPPASLFSAAETLEFQQGGYPKALAALRQVARSQDPGTRATALMRIARIHRKLGQWDDALAAYQAVVGMAGAAVEGLPAELVARQARLSVFEHQKRSEPAREEAARLLDALIERRWPLTRGAYEFYVEEAQRALGRTGKQADSAPLLALAAAVETLHEGWSSEEGHAGRRLLGEEGHTMLALWRGSSESTAAMVLGPKWLEAQLTAGLRSTLASQGVAIGLTDAEGRTVLGPRSTEPARQALRLASVTQLPWNLHSVTTNPDVALASSETRQRLLVAGLAVITALILTGSYLIGRAVTRELAVSRLQSDFVSAVSHEFRTPLTSLCLLTEQLASGRIRGEDDQAEYYGILARASQRLRRLVEGLLNFGRMEAGAAEYRFETIDPAELVLAVTREFQSDVEPGGYHVEVHVNGDTPLVRADRAALAAVVWNLLDNAVKYSPECLTVWAEVERNDGHAAIRIRDHGLGIPPTEQPRIFEKFVRGEAAKQGGIRGTGVGLAMVRYIVAAHRGEIKLESKPGEGSVFTVLLPEVS